MKLVLSRKGCDAGSGGCDSPVLDGKFISLPIPAPGIPSRQVEATCCPPLFSFGRLSDARSARGDVSLVLKPPPGPLISYPFPFKEEVRGSNPLRATEFIREFARSHRRAAPRGTWVAVWVAIFIDELDHFVPLGLRVCVGIDAQVDNPR